jgi:hypothetical protein
MPEYTLRNVDPQLWSQFTERANREGWPTRALIVSLMEAYARGDFTLPEPPPRELPQFGWLRAHYRQIAQESRFASLETQAQWKRLTEQVLKSPAGMSWRALDEVSVQRRPEILRWLRHTSNVPTAAGLTLRAIAHVGEGPDLRTNRRAFQYEVLGLPIGQQAWIADFDGGWRVLRVINGMQGHWSDPYLSKEEALNTLAETIDLTLA